jgi:hypothetical protein
MPDVSEQPDKIPVANAFSVADRNAHPVLQRTLELIDQVHTDGALPQVIFRHLPSTLDDGEYVASYPPVIVIGKEGRRQKSSLIHEIGHVIDQFGIGHGEIGA